MSPIVIGLGGFSLVCVFVIINLYRKVIWHEKYLLNLNNDLVEILKEIKKIDSREIFESDDEVGVLWKMISNIIKKLSTKLVG
jgi:hypothetical protein